MTARMKAYAADTPKFSPSDLLLCEKCGHEFPILPSAKKKVICPVCNWVSDKSSFVPLRTKRTLWVSRNMLLQYYQEVIFKQVMEDFYRAVDLYRQLFIRNVDMRAMNSLGFFAYGARTGIKLAYSVDISWEETAQIIKQHMSGAPKIFSLLDSAKVGLGAGRGRPLRPERITLLIDAMLLSLFPNGYLHFLRDALTLRYKEYAISSTYARAHRDRWERFYKSKKAVEVYCERIWKDLFGIQPEAVPEDWHLDVAREQGLTEGKDEASPGGAAI
jgi:hypothetical protein